jgi:PadR family transcriptional regulator PadR
VTQDNKRSSQLLKGVLDLCLLALLSEQPCYGYEMIQKLADRGLSLVSEGSIYPVLSRLEQGGYIEGYREPSPEGPSRKYYRLLPQGRRRLAQGTAEWERFAHGVNRVIRQGEANESD